MTTLVAIGKPEEKRVLIIEDDLFLVRLYQLGFEKKGITTVVAADGQSALAFLNQNPPHAVVLDLMLPGISGFDVLTSMRKNPAWKNVPVLIVSNLGQEQDIQRAKDLGIKEYTVKANMKLMDVIAKIAGYLA
jgi:DNA-binding response OmpR family regulator